MAKNASRGSGPMRVFIISGCFFKIFKLNISETHLKFHHVKRSDKTICRKMERGDAVALLNSVVVVVVVVVLLDLIKWKVTPRTL